VKKLSFAAMTATLAVFLTLSIPAEDKPAAVNWGEILRPDRPRLPAPREKVKWIEDLDAGLALAKKEGRPMFVTMRAVDQRILPFAGFQDCDLSWWGC